MYSCLGDVGDDGVERALVIVMKEHPTKRNDAYAARQRRAIVRNNDFNRLLRYIYRTYSISE